jgi:anti-sigma B factor antagonist
MRVALTTAEKLQVIIIRTRGKLTLGEGTSALRRKMRELAEGGYRRILLNMGDVTYIDNSGIAELVAAHTAVTNAGGEMKLLNLTKRAHDPLQSPSCTWSSRYLRTRARPSAALPRRTSR